MFETAALEHKLDKSGFKSLQEQLRTDLIDAEDALATARRRTVLVLVNGPDGAGKGEVLNRLYEWLDARNLVTMAYFDRDKDERLRPLEWRFWRDLPANGNIGIVLGSWYHDMLLARAQDQIGGKAFSHVLHTVNTFEAMLEAEGVILLKLWLHLDPEVSRERLDAARRGGVQRRPVVREWAAIDTRRERKRLVDAALEMIRVTSTGTSQWHVVPAEDPQYRDVAVGQLLLDTLRRADETASAPAPAPGKAKASQAKQRLATRSIVSALDLNQTLDPDRYKAEIEKQQQRLTALTTSKVFRKRGLICVFEGNDAAGKGGAIRRVRQALDPRQFRVHGIAAPNEVEKAHPYLWRFWRQVPRRGEIAFFDRSWYGRVLVERVEGFCTRQDWERAYAEINEFERRLTSDGYTLVKFWLAISAEEQIRRFKEREKIAFKRFKITPEDWRNRGKWSDYEQAVSDMVDRTSTEDAPWTLVEANDKMFARVKVLKTIADRLESDLE